MSEVRSTDTVTYDPRTYWSGVAERVAQRDDGSPLAGDDTPFQRYKRQRFIDRLLKGTDFAGRSVLEVGCGPGGNLIEVAALGAERVVGCDIAPPMVELAEQRTASLPNVSCVALDGGGLPFDANEFYIAFTVTVLQHNRDDEVRRLLTEMTRVARSTIVLIEDVGARPRAYSASYYVRRPRNYAEVLEPLGFRLVSTERLNVFVSEIVYYLLNGRLHGRPRAEGEPIGPVWAWIERATLPLTQSLDRRIPARLGLARMVFERG